MAGNLTVVEGVVRGGVIVPDNGPRLPEGERVRIVLVASNPLAELKAELDAWDHASEDAWRLIYDWEAGHVP